MYLQWFCHFRFVDSLASNVLLQKKIMNLTQIFRRIAQRVIPVNLVCWPAFFVLLGFSPHCNSPPRFCSPPL